MHIPRVLHFIWLGGALPARFSPLLQRWRELHPPEQGWDVQMWGDNRAEAFMQGKAGLLQFHAAPNLGAKSDVLRYELLLAHGGVYLDVDYECVQPLDALLDTCGSAFVCTSNTRKGVLEVNNGVIGCCAGHPLLHSIVQKVAHTAPLEGASAAAAAAATIPGLSNVMAFLAPTGSAGSEVPPAPANAQAHTAPNTGLAAALAASVAGGEGGGAMRTIATTGPGMFTRELLSFLQEQEQEQKGYRDNAADAAGFSNDGSGGNAGVVVLDVQVFHAVPNSARVDLQDEGSRSVWKQRCCTAESVAVHWWQQSWQKG